MFPNWNAHAKVKKGIFEVQLSENCSSLVWMEMIFEALRSSAFQIQVSYNEFENPKNPGFQSIHRSYVVVLLISVSSATYG